MNAVNRVPRPPIPQHDHYAELRYCAIHGGEAETVGPFRTSSARDKRVRGTLDLYPGSYQPSVRRYAIERPA